MCKVKATKSSHNLSYLIMTFNMTSWMYSGCSWFKLKRAKMLRSLPERERDRDRAFSPHFCLRVLQELQRVAWDSLWITVFDCYFHVWCPSFKSCQIDNDTLIPLICVCCMVYTMEVRTGNFAGCPRHSYKIWLVSGSMELLRLSCQACLSLTLWLPSLIDAKSQQLRFWDCKS